LINRDYVQTGKLKFIHRDFPLISHTFAPKAAEANRCADEQGKSEAMHDLLFNRQTALTATDLSAYAQTLGLDMTKFQACMDSGKYAGPVMQDKISGQQLGISSVPSFLIGVTDPNGKILSVKQLVVGAKTFDQIKPVLDNLLAGL
jgi:protein-disulfide isomerase